MSTTEVRAYTPDERKALDQIAKILQDNGLSPLDTLSAPYLVEIFLSLKKGHNIDLDVWSIAYDLTKKALANKEGHYHKETLRLMINDAI